MLCDEDFLFVFLNIIGLSLSVIKYNNCLVLNSP